MGDITFPYRVWVPLPMTQDLVSVEIWGWLLQQRAYLTKEFFIFEKEIHDENS